MAKATRICKVCGKEYEYCKTWLSTDKFRWQDVACSPACGAAYFEQIAASRAEAPAPVEEPKQEAEEPKAKRSAKRASKKYVEEAEPVDGVTDHDDGIRLEANDDSE